MRHFIDPFEYANRGGHLPPTSTRGLPTSTSSHLEATPCIVRITYITKNMAGTSTFYTSRTTTTTAEVRQVRLGDAKPHGLAYVDDLLIAGTSSATSPDLPKMACQNKKDVRRTTKIFPFCRFRGHNFNLI